MRRLAFVATVVVLGALGSGCGDDAGETPTGAALPAASAVPPDPLLYVEADISGEGEQHSNLNAILSDLGEVPLFGTPVDPKTLITQALEELGTQNGVDISYAEDFEPWLGNSLAVGYTTLEKDEPGFVLSIEVSDEEIARDSIERITAADAAEETDEEYDGVAYQVSGGGAYAIGVFEDRLVLATVDQFESAVDASRGDSFAATGDAAEALDVLDDDRLAATYVDTGAALDLTVAEGDADPDEAEAARAVAPEIFEQPLVAAIAAGERTVALDVAVGHPEDSPELSGTDRISDAPADAFAAAGIGGVGEQIDAILDRVEPIAAAAGKADLDRETIASEFESATGVPLDEILAATGDAVAFGRGELPDDFLAAVDVELTGSGDAPKRFVDGLEQLAEEDDQTILGPPLDASQPGFSAKPTPEAAAGSPVTFLNVGLGDDLSFLLASDRAVAEEEPAGTLGETPAFQAAADALGADYELLAFADLNPILEAVLGDAGSILDIASGASPDLAIAGFLAEKLGFAVAGFRRDGDLVIQRTIVGLDQP